MFDISKLSKDELVALNQKIVERLKRIRDAELLMKTGCFNVADVVSFDNSGKKCYGVVLRVNQKSITVATSSHESWKISPSFLKVVKQPPKKALDLKFEFFPIREIQMALEKLNLS